MRTGGKGANQSRRPASPPASAPSPPRTDTRRFKPELTPSWLHLATLLAGHEPPAPAPADGPRVAYLGGGRGFTAAVTAAVHPDADVWWWDPTLAGAEAARSLRDAAALPNLTVHQSPALHAGLGGGPRDLVVVDGVVDAVDPDRRAAVLAAAAAALRPGGLLCVTYRTEVGWIEVAPVHHLLRHLLGRDPRPVGQALADALAEVEALHTGGAQYLVDRPVVRAWWQELRNRPAAEVVEELGPGPLRPTSHAQLAQAVAPAGLSYVGPAHPDDLVPPGLPARLAAVVDDHPAPLVREALADLAQRRTHRTDVFRVGAHPLSERDRHRRIDAVTVTGVGRLDPTDASLRRLLPAATRRVLAAGPVPLAELGPAAATPADRETVLRTLLARDLVHPVVPHDEGAVTAAHRLTAVTNRAPVPTRHRIRVTPALGSALWGSAALTADQRHALGAP